MTPKILTEKQESCLNEIREVYPKLFRAYQLKEGLRAVFRSAPEKVEEELKRWLSWACRSKIKSFVELSRKIRKRKETIINTVQYHLSNARIESNNNKIKVLIRRSYGFRNISNMIDLILLVCSDIKLELLY